jgi:hypothetical protein
MWSLSFKLQNHLVNSRILLWESLNPTYATHKLWGIRNLGDNINGKSASCIIKSGGRELPCHWQLHFWSQTLDAARSNQRCRTKEGNRSTSSWNRSSKMSFLTSISVAASKDSCPLESWNDRRAMRIQYRESNGALHKNRQPSFRFDYFEERDFKLAVICAWTQSEKRKVQ